MSRRSPLTRLLFREPVVLLAISLLALGLRLTRLTFQPLWWDEGYSVYFSLLDLVSLTLKTAADIHPPFYYYLLHAWMWASGSGEATLRLFSVFTGVLTIPVLFVVGRNLVGRQAALVASLLLAVSPLHIYYSQEVRMYALAALLGLMSVHFAQRLLGLGETGDSQAQEPIPALRAHATDWIGYVFFTSLAIYTLYYAAFIPLFQTLYVLANGRRFGRTIQRWLIAQAALALLYLPWILLAGNILVAYIGAKMVVEARTPISLPVYVWDHLTAFSVGHALGNWEWLATGAVVYLALAALGLWGQAKAKQGAAWLVCWLGVPLGVGFLFNIIYPFSPMGYQRFLLYAQPAFLLLAASGLTTLAKAALEHRQSKVTLSTALALLSVSAILPLTAFYTVPRYPNDDYRPLIAQMAALGHPDDTILCVFPWQVGYLETYYPQPRPRIVEAPEAAWSQNVARLHSDLDGLLATSRRLWFPAHQKHGAILEQQIEAYLSQSAFPVANEWFGDTRLYFYTAAQVPPAQATGLSFDHLVDLASAAVGDQSVESGLGIVPVELHWRLSAALPGPGDYVVKLRLADAQGRTWAQRDSAPVAGRFPFSAWSVGQEVTDRHGLLIPAGTPPGTYQLRLTLYARGTEDPLTVADTSGHVLGPEAPLGTVQVTRSSYRPPPAALNMPYQVNADFAGTIRLLGFAGSSGPYRPGDRIALSLFWQSLAPAPEAYIAFVQLQDGNGKPWALVETADLGNGYTLDQLTPGETVRAQYDLLIPATAPDGQYHLVAGLLQPADKRRLPSGQADQVLLTGVAVRGRQHTSVVPPLQHPFQARFGDVAELVGYDLAVTTPGRTVNLTLYWRALKETATPYTVFVHLTDARGTIWGQHDAAPQAGAAPTTSWIAGEIISDTHVISIRTTAPPGSYSIRLGLYEPASGARLPVTEAAGGALGDALQLGSVVLP